MAVHGQEEEVSVTYARRVGERLRRVRKQKRLSLQAVEAVSRQQFKASVLGAYERGERSISVLRLQRLARFYNVPVDQLLPPDLGPDLNPIDEDGEVYVDVSAAERQLDQVDLKVVIDLPALEACEAPEREMLRRYLGMIQVRRQDFNGRILTIRGADVAVLGLIFQTTPEAVRRRLNELHLRL